jgi:YVTN family beta-propeller protein
MPNSLARRPRNTLAGIAFALLATGSLSLMTGASPATRQSVAVGPLPEGGQVVATRQLLHPVGTSVEFKGRPVDLLLSPDGKTLFAKNDHGLTVIDTGSWRIRQETDFTDGGGSMHGLAMTRDGKRLYATTSLNALWEAQVADNGTLTWGRKFLLPGPGGDPKQYADLQGIILSRDEKTAYVCLSCNNSLAVVDLAAGKLLKEIPVGIAPYGIVPARVGNLAYVSNWGGRRPKKGERTAKSADTDTLVDARGVGSSGTVSLVDLAQGRELKQIAVGLHPSDLALNQDGSRLYVANANSDTVSVIDTGKGKVVETILVRPDPTLPFGSAPNALALNQEGNILYVANGGNNAVAVVALPEGKGRGSKILGFIPTAWYPGALAVDDHFLYIANVKGLGSRFPQEAGKWDIYQFLGTIGKVPFPSAEELGKYTAQVRADGRLPQMLKALEKEAAIAAVPPVPVPKKLGEPSVFEHVVYIIKENKTYDQVFGDLPQGNGDPALCVFGREVSPNHHALAEQFILLDNFYCNGVCSADGHSWVTEGNVTDYLEKSFGGFSRAYSFGDDSLTFSSSGMIWNNVLEHGLSFRNYGEMDYATPVPDTASWKDIYQDYLTKAGKITFQQSLPNDVLRRYSCQAYPGWNLDIPDVLRADVFLRELKAYEQKGGWPDFTIVYLPDDHTSGGGAGSPTPRAQVADNDLALGRVVEGITKSRFWPKTCIFVIEDDPQSGFDHVDGHRSLCLVISPYTRRKAVISKFYNQTSVLHTMERILGLPPMNQMDALAPLMSECFAATPNLTPYTCLPNQISLEEMTTSAQGYKDPRYLAQNRRGKPFDRPDAIDDDTLNRAIWYSVKGPDIPYPAQFAGAHGRGLKALHLALSGEGED